MGSIDGIGGPAPITTPKRLDPAEPGTPDAPVEQPAGEDPATIAADHNVLLNAGRGPVDPTATYAPDPTGGGLDDAMLELAVDDAIKRTQGVAPGDSLSAIAKQWTDDPKQWPALYEANKGLIGANPDLIKPGQALQIPEAWRQAKADQLLADVKAGKLPDPANLPPYMQIPPGGFPQPPAPPAEPPAGGGTPPPTEPAAPKAPRPVNAARVRQLSSYRNRC